MEELLKIPNSFLDVREFLTKQLEKALIGPHQEDETIDYNPKNEYYSGIIYPNNHEWDSEDSEDEQTTASSESDSESSSISKDKLYKQSSFGLTCIIKSDIKKIKIKISYGKYSLVEGEKFKWKRTPFTDEKIIDVILGKNEILLDDNKLKIQFSVFKNNKNGNILDVYFINNHKLAEKIKLEQIIFQPKITLSSIDGENIFLEDSKKSSNEESSEDLHLKILLKNQISFGSGHLCGVTWDKSSIKNGQINEISTTFMPIEYTQKVSYDRDFKNSNFLNMKYLGNCESKDELKNNLSEIIIHYKEWIDSLKQKINSLNLEFEEKEIVEVNVDRIEKETIPRMEKSIEFISTDDKAFECFKFANKAIAWQQTMREWSKENISIDEEIKRLKDNTIKQQYREKKRKLSKEEREIELKRLKPQIEQILKKKRLEPLEIDGSVEWRLFQIAFILLNIESVFDEKSPNREIVDLLWFPTGGGKTEAYLGIIAFTIALRRLNGKNEKGNFTEKSFGVVALMRYTLRLLTVQQFQRAAALMCACEKLRREDRTMWGSEPFMAGLWVGGSVTPNKRRMAMEKKEEIQRNHTQISQIPSNNPYVLINCPWCGNEIKEQNGEVGGVPTQWRLYCGNRSCMFSKNSTDEDNSIPVAVTDEDVYSRCPSLVIATGDKFAQMAWNPLTSAIFGNVDRKCEYCGFYNSSLTGEEGTKESHAHEKIKNKKKDWNLRFEKPNPPELIIQDELHLISGSFGTVFALYESALEFLSTYKKNGEYLAKPKIIASTATIKSAQKQIFDLFNRRGTRIFPPQVLEFGNTFFSKIDNNDNQGQMYLGFLGTNKSGLSVQAKIAATILYNVMKLAQLGTNPEYLDPYYTMVSYYNAQKDLGGSSFSFQDSVPRFVKVIKNQSKFEKYPEPIPITDPQKLKIIERMNNREYELHTKELTSRQPSGEIPQILRELMQEYHKTESPIDLLLATNMLSTGVDIPRLGVMIVNGQPKKHSEYIQATGRIGRQNPGMIINLYAYTKYRDISQYENFRAYHLKNYIYVEDTGVTPFTIQSRQFGLFGMMVSVLRNTIPRISKNKNANGFSRQEVIQENIIKDFSEFLKNRVNEIDPRETNNTLENFEKLLNKWSAYIQRYSEILKYKENIHPLAAKVEEYYLLQDDKTSKNQIIPTPRSFRNTEQELNFFYDNTRFTDE